MQTQLEPTKKSHRILVLTFVILLTAGIIGGGVYYVLNQQMKKQDKLIEELQKKKTASNAVTQKEEEKKDEGKTETLASNLIDLSSIKVGDKVAEMVVQSIYKYGDSTPPTGMPMSKTNVKIQFYGKTTISGTFNYKAPGEPGFFDEFIDFTVDSNSLAKIPQLKGESRDKIWFGFSNMELAKQMFGVGSVGTSGKATITVDNYSLNRFPSEVFDAATFVQVIK